MTAQHEALKKFSYQIKYAADNYKPHGLLVSNFSNIIVAGMGGSGIGGQIVKAFYSGKITVPVNCLADYKLPAYTNQKTLLIACSYSGNTEETISVFNEALQKGCAILVITTGGELYQLASKNNLPILTMKDGFQPRMALGFSLTFLALTFAELLGENIVGEFKQIASTIENTQPYYDDAMDMFNAYKNKAKNKFVVLADGCCEAIATRFAQQVQENAKHECFVHALPEMNHNVIESYYGTLASVFLLLHANQNQRVTARFEFINSLLEVEYHKIISVELEQYNWLTIYETIHRLDWLSLFLADERRVDSLNVPNIKSLKDYLEQV